MLLKINPENPQERLLYKVVDCLKNDGIIIYPTDTVYGLGCDIQSKKALDRLRTIKQAKNDDSFSCILPDLKDITEYASGIDTPLFKVLKRSLPGPYTFILKASKSIPHFFQSKKKTVGVRVVDHNIPTEIARLLGRPLVTTSLRHEDEVLEYRTDPELIYEKYKKEVDIVVDGGPGGTVASTVIDATGGAEDLVIVREGKGEVAVVE